MIYQKNGSTVVQTFGFYPSQSADPFNPQVSGAWMDDSNHAYDVSATMNLNAVQFSKVISQILNFGTPTYHLDTMNCTDAAIRICNSMGMNLPDTYGSWDIGGGSNPGNLGQDIRGMSNSNVNISTSSGFAPNSEGACN